MGDDAFNKLTNTPTFTNVQQVIVRDIMTCDAKELFLIYDNKDQTVNRIIGLIKYLGQLYVFYAWFLCLKYDKNEEKVI